VESGAATHVMTAEIRYVGQGHELEVTLGDEELAAGDHAALRESFERAYEDLFGMRLSNLKTEAINWRMFSHDRISDAPLGLWSTRAPAATLAAAVVGERSIYLPDEQRFASVPVYDRYRLPAGCTFEGPALVQENESTIVLNGAARCRVDDEGNIFARL
jgi:N-methylhydantoinase A